MRVLATVIAAVILGAAAAEAAPQVAAASLPSSRRAVVDSPVTIFASMVNAGDSALSNCRPALAAGAPLIDFAYQTTDPATNALIGTPDTPVALGIGASQTFLLTFTPRESFSARPVTIDYLCDEASAPTAPGVNDLSLAAGATAGPDIIAIAVTLSGDGVARLNGANGRGRVAIAAVNLSAETGEVRLEAGLPPRDPQAQWLSPPIAGNDADLAVTFCQTDAGGACTGDTVERLNADIGATPATFTGFIAGPTDRAIAFSPGVMRLPVAFVEREQERVFGATSVALASNANAPAAPSTIEAGLFAGAGVLMDAELGEATVQRVDAIALPDGDDFELIFIRRADGCDGPACAPRQQTGSSSASCSAIPGDRLRCTVDDGIINTADLAGIRAAETLGGALILDYSGRPNAAGDRAPARALSPAANYDGPFGLPLYAYRTDVDGYPGEYRVLEDTDFTGAAPTGEGGFFLREDGFFRFDHEGCVFTGTFSYPLNGAGESYGYGQASGVSGNDPDCPAFGNGRDVFLVPDAIDANGDAQALRLVIMASLRAKGASIGLVRRRDVRLATWNFEFLIEDSNAGCVPRNDAQYEEIAAYARQLDADVIALQEVENLAAAQRVLDPAVYDFHISSKADIGGGGTCNQNGNPFPMQRTGFAVRRGIGFDPQPDLETLDVSGFLRHGVDIAVLEGEEPLRLMGVHLKSGCFFGNNGSSSCDDLFDQADVLEGWMEARASAGDAFALLGDFNRRLGQAGDAIFAGWNDGVPTGSMLTNANGGGVADCIGRFPDFIDHILLGEEAATLVDDGSFEEFTYDGNEANHPSDHCPSLLTVFAD
jgi:endonuclease/exonuclease/phosphatase family metal-dependent hydrolase